MSADRIAVGQIDPATAPAWCVWISRVSRSDSRWPDRPILKTEHRLLQGVSADRIAVGQIDRRAWETRKEMIRCQPIG